MHCMVCVCVCVCVPPEEDCTIFMQVWGGLKFRETIIFCLCIRGMKIRNWHIWIWYLTRFRIVSLNINAFALITHHLFANPLQYATDTGTQASHCRHCICSWKPAEVQQAAQGNYLSPRTQQSTRWMGDILALLTVCSGDPTDKMTGGLDHMKLTQPRSYWRPVGRRADTANDLVVTCR